jgi:hypothetical protein
MSRSESVAIIAEINSELAVHLNRAQRTLEGAEVFDVAEVRELMSLIARMEPQVRTARRSGSWTSREVADQMDIYQQQLQKLSRTLEQIRMMLVAKRGELEFSRRHMSAVTRWAHAYQQTR